MIDDIDWDHILEQSDNFAKEVLEQDGTTLCGVPLPSEIIERLCRNGLGKADPKSCYE